MERKVYLIIEHCLDNFDTHYKSYKVCSTKEMAEKKVKEDKRLSTEILSSTIKEVDMYE